MPWLRSFGVVAAVVFCSASKLSADGPPQSAFLEILKARSQIDLSYSANLTVTIEAGKDRAILAHFFDGLAADVKRNRPELNANNALQKAAFLRQTYGPYVGYYRVACDPDEQRFRCDVAWRSEWGEMPNSHVFDDIPHLFRFFDGDNWRTLATPEGTNGKLSYALMAIHVDSAGAEPPMPVLRGGGVEFSQLLFYDINLPARCRNTCAVLWKDLLPLLDHQSARDGNLPFPGETSPLPMVEIRSAGSIGTKNLGFRVRVWFDPDVGYLIAGIETAILNLDESTGKRPYSVVSSLRFSAPVRLEKGDLFTKCRWVRPTMVNCASDGTFIGDKAPPQQFEEHVCNYEFTEPKLGEPLPAEAMILTPPPGTHVTDHRDGSQYVVGRAGEILEKTALALAEGNVQVERPTSTRWRVIVAANVALLVVLAAGIVLRRRVMKTGRQ